jgi:hypothetical protein
MGRGLKPLSMSRRLVLSAVTGAAVPIFWGVVSMITFNAKESTWSSAYWWCVYITCPAWLLKGDWSMVLTPVVNGLMYGILGLCVFVGRGAIQRIDDSVVAVFIGITSGFGLVVAYLWIVVYIILRSLSSH